MDKGCRSPFFASKTENASALTNLNKIVTASGTATAISKVSQENANNMALIEAKEIAKVCANTAASLVNISQDYSFYVSNLNDSGPGSLRFAIKLANKNISTKSYIYFSVFSGTIILQSDLQPLINPVVILGKSSPDWNYKGKPKIILDLNGNNGLQILETSFSSIINGLEIKNSSKSGINILSKNCIITDCYIHDNVENGILLDQGSNENIIGEIKYDLTTGEKIPSNVINNNGENGIFLNFSQNNRIINNYIGVDYTGSISQSNGNNGIYLYNSDNNNIGSPFYTNPVTGEENNPTGTEGTVTPVFVTPPYGNLISGNKGHGIEISDCFNTSVYGNFVGINYSGLKAIPNSLNGVYVTNSIYTRFLGCSINNDPFVYYNVISGNLLNGILISYSRDTYVQGNFIGIGAQNDNLIPNGGDGLLVGKATTNTTVGGVIPLGNVISGNEFNGIHVSDTATGFETYNTFGGLFAFGGAAPNGYNGILFDGEGTNIRIGKSSDGRTNVFSGNNKNGIEIIGYVSDVVIESVIVGLNTDGFYPTIPNKENGIHIGGNCSNVTIGNKVNSIIFKNVVSGNLKSGILIDQNSSNILVTNTIVGLDIEQQDSPSEPVGNGGDGILINSNSNKVVAIYSPNVIAANGGNGIKIGKNNKNNIITNNYVGINTFGITYRNKTNPQIDGNPTTNIINDNILPTP
jgi:hypothetical protein